jgi:vacuolar-type H+-ATPase subunit C/Vma6
MFDYGNARVAAARSRLLGRDDLTRLRDAGSPAAMLMLLERFEDWRSLLGDVASLAEPPAQAIEAAIERFRARRLGALLRWYSPPAVGLVEALVVPLDVERLLAILRRRRAGQPSDRIGAATAPGALLDAEAIGCLGRASSIGDALDRACAAGLLTRDDARAVTRLAEDGESPEHVERAIVAATDRARLARVDGRSEAARIVRGAVEAELAVRTAAVGEAQEAGAGIAAPGERDATLRRLDGLAAHARRNPLGVGAVVGYVAAVEAQAIRLRAILAGSAGGWSPDLVGEYLHVGPGRRPAGQAV